MNPKGGANVFYGDIEFGIGSTRKPEERGAGFWSDIERFCEEIQPMPKPKNFKLSEADRPSFW
jgi:hypothetical protein